MKRSYIHISQCCILFSFAIIFILMTVYLLILKTSNDFLRSNYFDAAKDVGRLYALKVKNIDMCRNELLCLYNEESKNPVLDRLFFPQSYDRKMFIKLLIEGFEEELKNQTKIAPDTPASVMNKTLTPDLE